MDPIVIAPSDRLSRHYVRRVEQILARFNDIRELIQHEGVKGARVEGEVRSSFWTSSNRRYHFAKTRRWKTRWNVSTSSRKSNAALSSLKV